MNKAPLFSFSKNGLVLFGKSLSFSSLFAGVMIAVIVVVGGVSLSSSNPFSPDFAWSERSYENQQAYDSSSYEVQEQNKSDNQLHDEDSQQDSQDEIGNDISQQNQQLDGSIQDVVAGDDRVVVGEGGEGDSQGSAPSGSGGPSVPGGPSGPGTPIGPGDNEGPGNNGGNSGGGIDRDKNLYASVDSSEIEKLIGEKTTYGHIQSLNVSYFEDALPSVLYGKPITSNLFSEFLAPFVSTIKAVTLENGKQATQEISLSDIKLGKSTDTSADSETSYVIDESSGLEHRGDIWLVPVNIKLSGFLRYDTTISVEAFDAYITIADANGQEHLYKVHQSDFPNRYFSIPDELWEQALAKTVDNNGTMFQIFRGWTTQDTSSGTGFPAVGDGVTFNQGDDIKLSPLGYEPIPAGFTIELDDGVVQKLVSVDPSAVVDSTLVVPTGVNSVSFNTQTKLENVKTISIPSSVTAIDVASILAACPNLEHWTVEGNGRYSVADAGDNSQVLVDNGDAASSERHTLIVSILPSRDQDGKILSTLSVSLPEGVEGFGDCAFSSIESGGIKLTFTVESPDILLTQDAFSLLPQDTTFLVGGSVGDVFAVNRAYCSLLSKIDRFTSSDKNISVECQRGASTGYTGGSYIVDPSGAVIYVMSSASGPYSANDRILAYVPDLGEVAFSVPDSVTVLGSRAFVDAKSVKAVQVLSGVRAFCDQPFAGHDLESLVINAATKFAPIDSSAVLVASPSSSNPSLHVFLGCEGSTVPAESAVTEWKTARLNSYKMNVDSFLPVTEFIDATAGTIITDPKTGALYIENTDGEANGNKTYTLLRVLKSSDSFTFLEGTTAIAKGAFSGCSKLVLIDVPASVKKVEEGAFSGCSGVEVIYFNSTLVSDKKGISPAALFDRIFVAAEDSNDGDSERDAEDADWLATIGANADEGCENLKHVGDTITTTRDGDEAFYTASSTNRELVALLSTTNDTYTLLPNTTTIADFACEGCTKLKAIEGLGSVETIGNAAFKGCSSFSLGSADLASAKTLGDHAFSECGISGTLNLTKQATYGIGVFSKNKRIEKVVLSGSFQTLGDSTFAGCTGITSLTIAEGARVQSTGTAAFSGCTSLQRIEVNGGISTIGASTFEGCSTLASVTFASGSSSSLQVIDEDAFKNCIKLSLGLAQFKSLKSIGDYAFYNTFKNLSASLPASLETLGEYAFATEDAKTNETGLAHVTIAEKSRLRSIGDHAFENAVKLESVDMVEMGVGSNASEVTIGVAAFEGCVRLTQIQVSPRVTSIGSSAFENCSQLNTVIFGNPTSGSGASQLKVLGSAAFANCPQLKVVDLSNTKITTVPEQLFLNNTSLVRVALPATLKNIQGKAFAGCPNLRSLVLQATTPPSVILSAFEASTLKNLVVSVPTDGANSVIKAYQGNSSWRALFAQNSAATPENNIIAATNEFVMLGATYVTNASGGYTLVKADPSQVNGAFTPLGGTTEIGKEAFKNCTNLTMVHVPSSVKKIDQDAFVGCVSLIAFSFEASEAPWMADNIFGATQPSSDLSVYIHGNVDTLKSFDAVGALKKLHLTSMGDRFVTSDNDQSLYCDLQNTDGSLFARVLLRVDPTMTGLLNIDTETSVIYDKAAKNCTKITETTVPAKVASLGNATFMGATSLENAWLNNTNYGQLKTIGSQAFEGCKSLQNFNTTTDAEGKKTYAPIIPMSVSSIGTRAFAECDSLEKLQINGPVKKFPEEMMAGCDKLTQVSMGDTNVGGLEEIGARCYKNCTNITTTGASLTVFSGLKSIGAGAYEGCINLALVNFPKSLTTIGAGAFNGCSRLTAIAFNGAKAPSLRGTGLDAAWKSSRVFVPQPHWDTYESAFRSAGLSIPAKNESYISESYRAISGNIYAELTVVSAAEGTTAFLAPTKTTLETSKGAISVYSTAKISMLEVGPGALQGIDELVSFEAKRYVKKIGDAAFKDCANLNNVMLYPYTTLTGKTVNTEELNIGAHAFENTPSLEKLTLRQNTKSIGSYAFAQCATDFELDLSLMTTAANTNFGDHIFGDALPTKQIIVEDKDDKDVPEGSQGTEGAEGESEGVEPDNGEVSEEKPSTTKEVIALTILVKNSAAKASFIEKWGSKLIEEYGLSREEMEALFTYEGEIKLTVASESDLETPVQNEALLGDNETELTTQALASVQTDNVATPDSPITSEPEEVDDATSQAASNEVAAREEDLVSAAPPQGKLEEERNKGSL